MRIGLVPRVVAPEVRLMDGMDPILLEEQPAPGVVLLRLHRPAVLNALNLALRHALAEAFTRLDADAAVRVVILAGSERAFCAGADLHEYVDATPPEIIARQMDRLWGAISSCRKPVIAAVRGHALGGGCELAMGLAGEVLPDAEVEARALVLAQQMTAGPQQALQFIKEAVLQGMQLPLEQGLQFERKSFQLLFAMSDKTEGIRARLEKRPPQFHEQNSVIAGK